jgi:cytochrome c peroxidase
MNGTITKAAMAFAIVLFVLGITLSYNAQAAPGLTDLQRLGRSLYFDRQLSEPNGQSCADCHMPWNGFDDPQSNLPVSEGVIPGLFGGRNAPISAYAMFSPQFGQDADGIYFGGMFWDGRATGSFLGDPLADQAVGPFLNPVEMANPARYQVVRDVAWSTYQKLFMTVWNYSSSQMTAFAQATSDTPEVIQAYNQVGLSIAAYERTIMFGRFNSKYDRYLALCLELRGAPEKCATGTGAAAKLAARTLTASEWRGMQLFMGLNNDNNGVLETGEGAKCAACHVADWTSKVDYGSLPVRSPVWARSGMVPPLFADHTYDNLGIPVNPRIAELTGQAQPVDLGLGGVLNNPDENGKFRVVTLRNIGLSAPYGHNGYFTTLKDIVHFYNARDVAAENWPAPEYADTMNTEELGNLGLTNAQENDLVAFLKTLSDEFIFDEK